MQPGTSAGEYLLGRKEYRRLYREKNRERLLAEENAYRLANPERVKMWKANCIRDPDYRSPCTKTPEYKAARVIASGVRRKRVRSRTPAWADLDAIKFFYECCPKGFHVDHIIPLHGKLISGLHVENNLQWLPAGDNVRKSNKFTGY